MHLGDKTAGEREGRMKDAGKVSSRAGRKEDVGVREEKNNVCGFIFGAIVSDLDSHDILSCFEIVYHCNIASSERGGSQPQNDG